MKRVIVGLLPGPIRRMLRAASARRQFPPAVLASLRSRLAVIDGPLEPIGVPGREIGLDHGAESPAADLALALLSARTDGAHLLSDDEWRTLESTSIDDDWPDTARMLREFAGHRATTRSGDVARHRVVVDLRPLQATHINGTVTHARNVIDAVIAGVPPDVELEALVDPSLAPPAIVSTPSIARIFDPSIVDEVAVFIETSPLESKIDTVGLDTDPGIVRIGVWLDGIIGAHPEHFLRTSPQVFGYQYSLECVGLLDTVLALSACSRDEAIALGVEPDRVVITGCRSSLDGVSPSREPLPFERFVVIAGNTAPHKDLATAIIGMLPVLRTDLDLGVVVVASTTEPQRELIGEILHQVGIGRERIGYEAQVTASRMVQLTAAAEVVIVASLHEGFSLPVVEAIGLGTPVVVSDIAAHRELLGEGPWLFAGADPSSLAEALGRACRRPAKFLDLERAALAERYDPTRLDRVVSEEIAAVLTGVDLGHSPDPHLGVIR